MANGDHDWTAAEVVTAANMDDYLQLQTVQKFATSAARDAALSARKREGMHTYQDDSNSDTVYSGAAWSTIGPLHGAWTAWTPTVTQSVSVTATNNNSRYQRIGRTLIGMFFVTVTGAGTAANNIIVGGLPFATAMSTAFPYGQALLFDTSANLEYGAAITLTSTTSFIMRPYGITVAGAGLGSNTFTAGLAVGDTIAGTFTVELAADA